MSNSIRTSLTELMTELKEGITKMNDRINETFNLISFQLQSLDDLASSNNKELRELKDKIRVNDLAVRSLGDALESLSIRILSLHAPVSRDLRRVISSFRMIYDLQRISRDTYNAFSDILDANPMYIDLFMRQIADIQDILEKAKHLLANFIKVYQLAISEGIDRFEGIIKTSIELDTQIDKAFTRNTKVVIEKTTVGTLQPLYGYYLLASFRSLERVGDHCCNLIERAIYIQSGEKVTIK